MVADPRELGAVIRRMRLASGLSQEQLAERSGLSVRAVSDLERGQRSTPRPETIRMLADGMHLSRQDRQELLFAARPELRPSATPQGSDPLILHRLPETPSQLIGRERDVASLVSLMTSGNQPLTTLTGPGGVGKTRLAVEAAHQAAQFFSAVVFVDLAAVSVPEQVASAIAQSMGIQEAGDQSIQDTLVSALRNRQMLLVLDNFEQVIAAAEMVGELLFRLPNLRVVVTSREALRIRAEYELPVEPLELPEDQNVEHLDQLSKSSAVAMFVAAAQSVNDDFDLNQENARAIASICRRLDGLPLAIELAGSRVRHFPPTVLLERLERSLPVLTGGARDAPVRQRTLRNTIAWSFDLLTPDERALFRRVGAFPGGASLAALDFYASVAGPLEIDLLSGLASLVDKNLVRERFGADGLPRFLMLETIREFAVETRVQAGEWESGRTVIKKWALEFLASARGSDSAWFLGRGNLVRIGEEVDNVRLAFEVASDAQDATSASLIFNGTNGYFYLRGMFQEALAQAKRVMDLAETAPLSNALRARTLSNLAGFWNAVYDAVAAEELARRALALAEHESEDGIETLLAMIVLVMTLRDQGRYVEAMMYAEKADALASKPDATQYKPWTTFAIGKLSYLMDDRDRAADFLSESMRLSLTFGPNEFSIHCGNYLAAVHLRRGDLRAAASMLRTAVQLWREAGAIGGGGFLDEAAVLAAASGHPEIAATLFSANSEQNAQFGIREDDDRWTLEAYEAACYQLGNEAFDRAAAAGRMLDFERAVDLVVHLLDTIEAQESNRTGKPDRDDA